MNSLKPEYADKLCEVLSLTDDVSVTLQEFPHKSWDKLVPTDPVIYRLYEMVGVSGDTIKEIIHEKFGDGIMVPLISVWISVRKKIPLVIAY